MTTTVNPTRSQTVRETRPARPRVRASAHARDGAESREAQYDLLTAALLGAAIGAGTTLLLRRGPSGRRPIAPAFRLAGRGARMAGRGARKAWDRGVDLWDRVPREEIEGHLRDYFESARDTIEDAVASELKDLRKAMRRRRRKLGL